MLTITLDDAQVRAELQRLVRVAGDMKPALKDIGADFKSRVQLEFRDQQNPYGEAWQPLSPRTIAQRRKRGRGAQILRDKGLMANSTNYQMQGDNSVAVGVGMQYSRYHQEGTRRIPKRLIVPEQSRGLPPEWQRALETIVQRHIEQGR